MDPYEPLCYDLNKNNVLIQNLCKMRRFMHRKKTESLHDSKKTISQNPSRKSLINSLAAVYSGVVGLLIFHPMDVAVKRKQAKDIMLGDSKELKTPLSRISSSYKGLMAAGVLSLTHKIVKYGGEPAIKDKLQHLFPENNPIALHAISGFLTGATEALIDPLSRLKTRKITRGGSYKDLWKAEIHPYGTAPITLIRNGLGTSAFFMIESFMRLHVYHVSEDAPLSFKQKMTSSTICPAIAILISHPADSIKTRMQTDPAATKIIDVCMDVVKKRGFKGFYAGLPMKLAATLPRAGAGYLLFQFARDRVQLKMAKKDEGLHKSKSSTRKP